MPARTILVMDDSPTCLHAARVALEAAGFVVVTVKDAAGFVETLYRKRPDLALVDVSMPGFGGEDVVRFLESQPGSRCRVVFYSSEEESLLQALSRKYAVDGYIRKTTDPATMAESVKLLLERGTAPGSRRSSG